MCPSREPALSGLDGEASELPGPREAFLDVVRSPGGPVSRGEHIGERLLVADSARHLKRLARERRLALINSRVGERRRQAAHKPRPECALLPAERNERPLQELCDRPGHGWVHLQPQRSPEAERRASELDRITQLLGKRGRPEACLTRLLQLAGAPARLAERKQQLALPPLVQPPPTSLGTVDGTGVMGRSFVVGQPRRGLLRRGHAVANRLVGIAPAARCEEVTCKLGGIRLGALEAERLERLPRPPVEQSPAYAGWSPVEGLPHESMGEAKPSRHLFELGEEPGIERLLERSFQLTRGALRKGGERFELELLPENGGERQGFLRSLAEACQSALDHLTNTLRDADTFEQLRRLGRLLRFPERIVVHQLAQHLYEEERVSAGLLPENLR